MREVFPHLAPQWGRAPLGNDISGGVDGAGCEGRSQVWMCGLGSRERLRDEAQPRNHLARKRAHRSHERRYIKRRNTRADCCTAHGMQRKGWRGQSRSLTLVLERLGWTTLVGRSLRSRHILVEASAWLSDARRAPILTHDCSATFILQIKDQSALRTSSRSTQ